MKWEGSLKGNVDINPLRGVLYVEQHAPFTLPGGRWGIFLLFCVPGLLGQGQHMAINAGELGLGGLEFFSCDLALVQKAAQVFGFLLQPGELAVDVAQGAGSGGIGIMTHTITS